MTYHAARIAIPLALAIAGSPAPADDLSAFRAAAAPIAGQPATARPEPRALHALAMLVRRIRAAAVLDTSDRHIDAVVRPFDLALRKMAGGGRSDPDRLAWAAGSAARRGRMLAVAASLGPVSTVEVTDTAAGTHIPVPPGFRWMHGWQASIRMAGPASMVVIADRVEAMGYRIPYRVDLLERGDRGLRVAASWERTRPLDLGGATVRGNRIGLVSVEWPSWFLTSAAGRLFERDEVYVIERGRARCVSDRWRQPELRYLDRWMARAAAAKSPTPLQRRALALAGEMQDLPAAPRVIELPGSRVAIDLAAVRAVLERGRGGYRVLSVARTRVAACGGHVIASAHHAAPGASAFVPTLQRPATL